MHRRTFGFTIVELLVVIVVIGVLASISLISYTGISNKAKEAAVIADLSNTTKQLKLFQIENSGFPTTIRCDILNSPTNKCIKPSGDNTLGKYTVDNTPGSQAFCLTVINSNIKKHIDQDGIIADGACTYAFPEEIATNSQAPTRYVITLSWPAIDGAESYELQRATNSDFTANPVTLTPPAAGASSYDSSGLTPSTTYYYRMKVTIAGDESNWSPAVNATTAAFPAPANLVATTASRNSINLSWTAVSGATAYTLQRSTDPSFVSPAPTAVATTLATTATSSSLSPSTTYYYRISATDAGGTSSWSTNANATTSAFVGPTGLAMTSHTTTSISLSWGSIAGASYTLERSANSSFTSPTTAYSGTNTSTTVTGLVANTNYYFRVRATESGSTSAWSGSLLAMTVSTLNYIAAGSYTWVVPSGVSSITIEAWGAQGGNGETITAYGNPAAIGGTGGLGGYGKGTLAVSAGQTINITVGASGSNGAGGSESCDPEACWIDGNPGQPGGGSVISRSGIVLINSIGGNNGYGGSSDNWGGYGHGSDGAVGGSTVNAGLTATSTASGVNANNNRNGKITIVY